MYFLRGVGKKEEMTSDNHEPKDNIMDLILMDVFCLDCEPPRKRESWNNDVPKSLYFSNKKYTPQNTNDAWDKNYQ